MSEDVLARARGMNINVSEVCQRALEQEIEGRVEKLRYDIEAGRQAARLLEQLNGAATGLQDSEPGPH